MTFLLSKENWKFCNPTTKSISTLTLIPPFSEDKVTLLLRTNCSICTLDLRPSIGTLICQPSPFLSVPLPKSIKSFNFWHLSLATSLSSPICNQISQPILTVSLLLPMTNFYLVQSGFYLHHCATIALTLMLNQTEILALLVETLLLAFNDTILFRSFPTSLSYLECFSPSTYFWHSVWMLKGVLPLILFSSHSIMLSLSNLWAPYSMIAAILTLITNTNLQPEPLL